MTGQCERAIEKILYSLDMEVMASIQWKRNKIQTLLTLRIYKYMLKLY